MALQDYLQWSGGTDTKAQINQKLQEMIEIGEISGEGWAVVKTGQVTFASIEPGTSGSLSVDVSEFGFTSADDYEVALTLAAIPTSSFRGVMIYRSYDSTNTRFGIVAYNGHTAAIKNVVVIYAVISKSNIVSPVQEALVQKVVDNTIITHTGVWEGYDSATDELIYTDDEAGQVNERRLSIKPDAGYRVVASGVAGQTYEQQLTSLQTAYRALTVAERLKSQIIYMHQAAYNSVVNFICTNAGNNYGYYTRTGVADDGKAVAVSLGIMTGFAMQNTAGTITDLATTAHASPFQLIVID